MRTAQVRYLGRRSFCTGFQKFSAGFQKFGAEFQKIITGFQKLRALFTLRRVGQKTHVGQKNRVYQKDSNKEEFYVLFREKAENGSVK